MRHVAPPQIIVDAPPNNAQFDAGTTVLVTGRGIAAPFRFGESTRTNTIVQVTINNVSVDALDATGNFFSQVDILPGMNVLEMKAVDALGQTAATSLTLEGVQPLAAGVDTRRSTDVSASIRGEYGRTSFDESGDVLYAELAVRNEGQYEADAPLLVGVTHISDPAVAVLAADADGRTADGIPYFDFTALVDGKTLAPGEVTSSRHVSFYNPQRIPFTYDLVVLGKLNEAPQVTSHPIIEAVAERPYAYRIEAIDPNDDALSYSLATGPRGMSVDATGGQLSWTPTSADVGTHGVTLQVDDSRGGIARQTFALSVSEAPPNRPPVFGSVPNVSANVGLVYEYQATANDADGDTIEYTVVAGPAGLEIDAGTGLVSWLPGTKQVGKQTVTLAASDGQIAARQIFTLDVRPEPQNHLPLFSSDPVLRALEGDSYQYAARAIDPDGDELAYILDEGPYGMTVESATGVVDWPATVHSPFAVTFDGNDYVETDLQLDKNARVRGVTMEAWVYPTENRYGELITTDNDSGRNWGIYQFSRGWMVSSKGSGWAPGVLVDLNTWQHIAVVFEPGVGLHFYKNGESVAFREYLSAQPVNNRVTIGRSLFEGVSWHGAIDEVRIWEGARTHAEIQDSMQRLLSGDEPDLLGYWRFDEGNGDLAYDLSGNGHHGTLTSADPGERPEWSAPGGPTEVISDVSIQAVDGHGGLALQSYSVEVAGLDAPNSDPMITSTPPLLAAVQRPYFYWVTATDPDGDLLQFALGEAPTSMSIDARSGQVTWSPSEAQLGVHQVVVQVTDSRGLPVEQTFEITVAATLENRAPEITSAAPQVGLAGQLFRYDVVAIDPDADRLRFDLPVRPEGMAIDEETGRLRWLPGTDQVGLHDVIVRASDGRGLVDLQPFVVDVARINRAPEIESAPPVRGREGQQYEYLVRAQDADGDALTYQLLDGPSGMTLDPATGVLEWNVAEETSPTALEFHKGGFVSTSLHVLDTIKTTGATFEAWVYPYEGGLVFDTNNINYDPGLSCSGDDWTVANGAGHQHSGLAVDRDAWQHIAVVYLPDIGIHVYKNGEEFMMPGIYFDDSARAMRIGQALASGKSFTGRIDEVRFWGLPRTAEQIRSEMHRTLSGNEQGLVAYWPFDEAAGTTAYDQTENGHHATLARSTASGSAVAPTWTSEAAPVDLRYRTVTIQVEDGRGGVDTQTFALEVGDFANDPPFISSQPEDAVLAGQTYYYPIKAIDPNGDPLVYSFDNLPVGMTVDPSGLVAWDTTANDLGSHLVTVRVEDGQGGFVTQTFTLDVIAQHVNEPPLIVSLPRLTALIDEPYTYAAAAVDLDNDPVAWVLEQAPEGMWFDKDTTALRWTPASDQVGTHDVRLRVADVLGATHSQQFTITVQVENAPPVVTSTPITQGRVGDYYRCPFQVYDREGWGPLMYSLPSAPAGMEIDPDNGLVQWDPQADQQGTHDVEVQIQDDQGGVVTQPFQVEVTPDAPNRTPTITSTPPFFAKEGLPYEYTVTATDPDAEPLRYELRVGPTGMTIDPDTGLVQWAPQASDMGDHDVTVGAFDAIGAGGLQRYVLTVQQSNRPPEIMSVPVQQVTAGLVYRYDVWAGDPDGDPLTYSLDSAPAGMNVDDRGRITWQTRTADLGAHAIVSDGQRRLGWHGYAEL